MSNTIGAEIIDWLAEKGALVQFNNAQRHLLSIQIDDKFDRRVRPLQDALLLHDAIGRVMHDHKQAVAFIQERYPEWDGTADGSSITLAGCANLLRDYVERLRADVVAATTPAAGAASLDAGFLTPPLSPSETDAREAWEQGWSLAHERATCGHPRACWQAPNYPHDEKNTHCVVCAELRERVEARYQEGLRDGKAALANAERLQEVGWIPPAEVEAREQAAQAAALEMASKHVYIEGGFCRCGGLNVSSPSERTEAWQQHIRSLANIDALSKVKARAALAEAKWVV